MRWRIFKKLEAISCKTTKIHQEPRRISKNMNVKICACQKWKCQSLMNNVVEKAIWGQIIKTVDTRLRTISCRRQVPLTKQSVVGPLQKKVMLLYIWNRRQQWYFPVKSSFLSKFLFSVFSIFSIFIYILKSQSLPWYSEMLLSNIVFTRAIKF